MEKGWVLHRYFVPGCSLHRFRRLPVLKKALTKRCRRLRTEVFIFCYEIRKKRVITRTSTICTTVGTRNRVNKS